MRERTDGQGFATRAIHAGERPDPVTHAHKPPIYATSTFAFDTAAEKEDAVDRALAWEPGAYFYSRTGNPTNRALEEKIASLEGAEDCVVSSSGMAAVSATLFAHLGAGDHLIVGDELFAITGVLLDEDFPRRGIDVTAVDMTDLTAVEAAITAGERALFMETIVESAASASPTSTRSPTIAQRHELLFIADNTFLGPALVRPIEHGADLVLNAATKYLSGHGDAVSGRRFGSQGPDRSDPQADRYPRPGRQPLRELPGHAWRADAPAAVASGVRQCRDDRGLPGEPRQGGLGPLSGPRLAPGSRCRPPSPGRPLGRDADIPAARRRRPAWPRSRITSPCATSA